jgi:pyruvate/2-oxoglutarate dehydrogenase complex dihydrolipoamide dehydrogenase (E3) component
VRLFESSNRLGGQLAIGAIPPAKQELLVWIQYAERQLRRLGVEIHLGERVGAEIVARLAPDVVLLATGGVPARPPIPGIDSSSVATAVEVLDGRVEPGERVVILGGGETGCETADYLASRGRRVTVVEMMPEAAREVMAEPRHYLFERLKAGGVEIRTLCRAVRVAEGGVQVEGPHGSEEIPADTVVLAVGVRSNRVLMEELRDVAAELHVIGDAEQPGNAAMAIRRGFELGSSV